ncbi:MAG TPA: DoxX family protein [Cyclobacteriaceae bacterium]
MKFLRIELPERIQDFGLLIFRVGFGFSLLYGHGFGKLLRLLGPDEIKFGDPYGLGPTISLGLATFAEVICAVLIMVGLFTRAALIPMMFTMFTVVFVVNFGKDFGDLEKAILFGLAFAGLFLSGPGKYSIDAYLKNTKLD